MGIIQTIKVNGYAVSDYENNLWLKSFCLPYVPTENWAKKLLKCTAKINECITKRNKILGIDYEKISYTDDEVFILNLNINKKMNYIKLMRSLKDKSYYSKDSEKLHLWVHLLLTANWNDREEMLGGKPIICKAGQFTTGRKQLSKETGINESKVERLLTYFEKNRTTN